MKETKFKNSEVGLIPEDWDVVTLEKLFDIIPNNTLSRECLNYSKGEYQNVHYGDVLIKFIEYIDCEKDELPFVNSYCKFNKSLLKNGDVIMADTAEDESAGKVSEITNLYNKKIVSGLHTIPLRPKIEFASKFLGYAMNALSYHRQLFAIQSGTKVTSVSKSSIIKTKLAFPRSLTEQSRIATALSDIDALIATTKKLIEKKRNIKEGAMQELLSGKRRIVGFAKTTKCKLSEVGVLPEDWVSTSLSSIGEVKMCKRILKEQTSETGDVPFYKIGTFGKEADAYISRRLFESFKSNYPYPKKGTLLISAAGTIGRTVVFDGLDSYFQDSNIVWIDHKEESVLNHYLEHYFKVIIWKSENGGTISRLYNDNLRSTYLAFPKNKEEQKAIASVLSDMDSEIQSLESRLTKYQSLKQGMMQQLLTGKIRLI